MEGIQTVSQIESTLHSFCSLDVRVKARRFSPDGKIFTFSQNVIFQDGSESRDFPVFFEGRLLSFKRQIGVFVVVLGARTIIEGASDGLISLREKLSVIMAGPAIVELDYPVFIERLPYGPNNYWRDIRFPKVQFEFELTKV